MKKSTSTPKTATSNAKKDVTAKNASAKNVTAKDASAPKKTLTSLNVENLQKTAKAPEKTQTQVKSNLYAKENPAYIELLAKCKKESKVRGKIRTMLENHCTAINIAYKKSKNAPKDNELKKELDAAIVAFRKFTALYYAKPNSLQAEDFRTFKEDETITATKKDSNAAIVTCFAHLKELSK